RARPTRRRIAGTPIAQAQAAATCALRRRVTINSSSPVLNSAATLSSDGVVGIGGMGDKSSALAWVWVVDGRSQHIHGQLRAKLRRIEADVESESVLPVFGRHDR